ncbi:NfeD family protein [Nakamurella aerolata]|uniref:NfeD family protein n=1 Tax=Nakamurella aerolata TaxID=1656892 RepID=A0A849A8N6_9ACTN|nr:NfeD family protein [Nakamurella aerolata]NNG35441.1 NfeD family protein [Nakamurella aerolata]
MDPVTLAFLLVGALGLVVLVVALLGGEFLHLAGTDADGPFSLPVIAAFVGGAGFVGAIPAALLPDAMGTGGRIALSAVIGLLGALPLAFGALRLTAAVMHMRTDPTLTEQALAGALGVVITPIGAGGYGEVRIRVHGQDLKYAARSDEPLAIGTPVFVTEALSATAVEVVSTAAR